ncbi:M15 family metallopeptidase [Thalassotalea piscium]|uniref:LAS superfamily LD-carboxypeptidase LdcB n=1 Tax=Thalassotalea piscium TaxID=1230533 RepID=A0A7X0NGZ4_9GAMM|nr:M15 family metallopeptidase [Thalassotalea piscium]MBB6543173.1 LAS superfamily LD-carboxypeptidase LdcB [Thalassotalea piscium]
MKNSKVNLNQYSSCQALGKSDNHLTWLPTNLALHHSVVEPWNTMVNHAKKSGLELTIASSYRSFERQLSIWNRKFTGELAVRNKHNDLIEIQHLNDTDKVMAILTFSALPGASRHHWGTDIDIYASNLLPDKHALQLEPWEYQAQGYFYKLSLWLAKNADQFGFFFPYAHDQGGVAIEPWHISYKPIAQHYQDQLTLPLLSQTLKLSNIEGKAAILANLPIIFEQYITNINEEHYG